MTISEDHHYVPEWYQRQFLPQTSPHSGEFFVLDKSPATSKLCPDGLVRTIRTPRHVFTRGPHKLFQLKGLYSVALRGVREDAIERFLFGRLDNMGARACQLFNSWPVSTGFGPPQGEISEQYGHPCQRMMDLLVFMNAQKARTPKGIAQIKHFLAKSGQLGVSNNVIIAYFQQQRQLNCTVWAEGMWEIFSANTSDAKFLLSDDPVMIYNCDCYPASAACQYPHDPDPFWRGSRVIYPLSPNHLLVISHVEHVDDPSRAKARRPRRNARSHDDVILHYGDIINNRELSCEDVSKVNYLLKVRAAKYIASPKKDDLYPENSVGQPTWCELDKIFYPKYRSFRSKTTMMVGYEDGSVLHSNAFGERDTVPGWFVRQQERKGAAAKEKP